MDDIKWLTYAELAGALGITVDSGKNLVRRKRWQRRSGNDGLARVGVPLEYLVRDTPQASDTPHDTPSSAATMPDMMAPSDPPQEAHRDGLLAAIEVLQEHIVRMEAEIVAVKEERDAERLRGSQVEVLTAVLEIEKQRSVDLRQERDRWAKLAEDSQRHAAELAKPRGLWAWLRAGA